jgi:hypothetical protein
MGCVQLKVEYVRDAALAGAASCQLRLKTKRYAGRGTVPLDIPYIRRGGGWHEIEAVTSSAAVLDQSRFGSSFLVVDHLLLKRLVQGALRDLFLSNVG